MVGIPPILSTKQDWHNAVDYAIATGEGQEAMRRRLTELKNNTTMLVLKDSAKTKPPEEQTPDDFKAVENPNSDKKRLGFTDDEIEQLIGRLN